MDKRIEERRKRIVYAIKILKDNPESSENDLLLKIMAAFMIGKRYAKEYLEVASYEVKNGGN